MFLMTFGCQENLMTMTELDVELFDPGRNTRIIYGISIIYQFIRYRVLSRWAELSRS